MMLMGEICFYSDPVWLEVAGEIITTDDQVV